MDSLEYNAIINCRQQLEIALKDDRDIVQFLRCKHFIDDEIQEFVLNSVVISPLLKSGKLVKKIIDKVRLNSKHFYTLLQEFKNHGEKYSDIIEILELQLPHFTNNSACTSNSGKS